MPVALAIVLALWTAILPRVAQAAETDAAAAEALFQKARAMMLEEDYDAACQFFLESLALDEAVGTVMNLAACEEKRGHLTSSWERWNQALRLLEPTDDRATFANEKLDSISERLSYLTIHLTGAAAHEVVVRRDGVVLGEPSLGQELPADPGPHVVTVESERFEARQFSITLTSGEHAELLVQPGPLKPRVKQSAWERNVEARRVAGYAGLGLGVLGVTAALVTGILLPVQDQKVQENCPGRVCNEVGTQAIADAQLLLALNTASWITAGVGVAAGSALLLTLPRAKKSGPEPMKLANRTDGDRTNGDRTDEDFTDEDFTDEDFTDEDFTDEDRTDGDRGGGASLSLAVTMTGLTVFGKF